MNKGKPTYQDLKSENEQLKKRIEELEKKRDRYQKQLASTLDAVDSLLVVVDKNLKIVLSNWKDHEWVPEEQRKKKPFCYEVMKNFDRPCKGCPPLKTFKDGKPRWYEDNNPLDGSYKQISVTPIFDEKGKVEYVLENVRDVTDHKKAEEAREKALEEVSRKQKIIQNIFDTNPNALYIHDIKENRPVFQNYHIAVCIGYSNEELKSMGNNFFRVVAHPEDLPRIENHFNRLKASSEKDILDLEYRMLHKNGTWRWFYSKDTVYSRDKDGQVREILGSATDITEQKKVEEQLRESEENLKITLNSIGDAVISTDLKGKIIRMNPVAEAMTGWSIDESQGKPLNKIFRIINANTGKKTDNPVSEVLKSGKIVGLANHTMLVAKNGNTYNIADSAAPIKDKEGNITGVVLVFQDVTENYQKNRQIRESKVFLDAVFQSIQDGISVLNPDLSIRYVNPVMEEWYHWKKPLVGKKCYNAYHNSDKPCQPCPSLRCMKSGQTEREIVPGYPDPDSPVSWVELFSYPIKDPKGNITGVVEFVRDITERVQAREKLTSQKERLANILEGTDAGTWEWNVQTGETIFNEKWAEFIGYTLEELSPVSIDTWIQYTHPDDLEKSNKLLEKHFAGKTDYYECEARMKHKKGHWIWVLDRGKVISRTNDGKPLWMFGTHQEITKRKEAEAKIIAQNKEYEILNEEYMAQNEELKENLDYIKEINSELEKAKERAEESDRLKSAFLANMSHEIRTPMNGILGFAGLLKNPKLTGEKQNKYIQMIEQSGKRMLNIINDLIDISKVEAGQVEVQHSDTDINEQLDYLYTFFKPEADKKYLQFSLKKALFSEEAIIKTDKEKLYRILTNLIQNAIKYTDQGQIEYGYGLENDFLRFYVKDTGIGIPGDKQKTIFERFVRADLSISSPYEGAGLGLSITKAYVNMLGGDIWMHSKEGKGSVFYFTLPYSKKEEPEEQSETFYISPETEEKLKNTNVLIVEDEETSIAYLNEIFEDKCKQVFNAKTGQEAVNICKKDKTIDLVLMDIKMPDMDGYTATQKIREFNKKTTIIAETAYALEGDRSKAIEAGCNDYVSKPIDLEELFAVINKNLKADQ
jgi:PAS domain S-box-containing protein